MSEGLSMWTIYCDAADYPGEFVARRQVIDETGEHPDPEICARGKTLRECRAQLPQGLTWLNRDPSDPPQIVETWL